jgi:hypothetical protein
MKRQILTLMLVTLAGTALLAQDPAWGTGWTTLQPGSPLLLEEDFTGFPFVHSDSDPNQGNSDNLDPEHPGYKDTLVFRQAIGSIDTIFYEFYQCAFAPNWMPAYWYRDSVDGLTPPTPPEVSRGFVEISREYESWATIDGYFIIDLSQVEFIEAIRYTHSSTGGNKRGFTLAMSKDYGETWDTIRMQTVSLNLNRPQPNPYTCQNSAYGMLWEDGLYVGSLISPGDSVLLRFTKDYNGQTVRLHDLKIYGDRETNIGINDRVASPIRISAYDGFIRLSEPADIRVFDINGRLMRQANRVESLYIRDLPSGVYIIKARTDTQLCTGKIFN